VRRNGECELDKPRKKEGSLKDGGKQCVSSAQLGVHSDVGSDTVQQFERAEDNTLLVSWYNV
jgi:hypothetical protein